MTVHGPGRMSSTAVLASACIAAAARMRDCGVPNVEVGARFGPFDTTVDPDRAHRFAAALDGWTGRAPGPIPPTFLAALTRDAMMQALVAAVPAGAQQGGVHGEQDMRFDRPLVPHMRLRSTSEVYAVRPGSSGSRVTLRITTVDGDGRPVGEQLWTTFFRGADLGPSAGPDLPDHARPEVAPVGATTVTIAADQPLRYGAASGEDSSIHVDEPAARAAGFRTVIAHGMCTLALCARAAVALTPGDDWRRARRLVARFAGVAYPGSELHIPVYRAGSGVAFEAFDGDRPVLTHGRVELP